MEKNEKIIADFYDAFSRRDVASMVKYYAPDVLFTDPAFGVLTGDRAKDMWRMLIGSQEGKLFDVVSSNVKSTAQGGSAKWQATYIFSQTGRKVVNNINAEFTIVDGKIVKHIDSFSLWKWARQAMGLKGFLLGGTAFFRRQLQKTTNSMLDKWQSQESET